MNHISSFKIKTFVVGYIQTNMYLISNHHKGVVIDPGFIEAEADYLLKEIEKECTSIAAIFLTHGHFDHISGCPFLKAKFSCGIYCHSLEAEKLNNGEKSGANFLGPEKIQMPEADQYFKDDEDIELIGLKFKVLETPGHTKGGVSILLDDRFLFSGDTIFKDGIGRTDLYDGSYKAEISSIREKILRLPPDTIIYPGHGPATSVKDEKKNF